jgi:NAD(P)-dependent dehydrogenase (short-subunit alcohol dehydrogenase family)
VTYKEDARAVVTGAASGMGEATARRLVSEGVEVLAVDVNEAGMAHLGCETMVVDLGEPDDRARVAERARGFDYLVNSAASIQFKPIFEFTVDDWRRVFRVNAESTFFLCQTIGPTMRPGGAIVNFSSTSAKLSSTIEAAPYAATKTAILSITRSFAYALADRPVRVNAIVPGITNTPMQEQVLIDLAAIRGTTPQALSDARDATVPLKRGASSDEAAGVICFLLSEEAAYITGENLNFSGGMVMW